MIQNIVLILLNTKIKVLTMSDGSSDSSDPPPPPPPAHPAEAARDGDEDRVSRSSGSDSPSLSSPPDKHIIAQKLMEAAKFGDEDTVTRILRQGVDTDNVNIGLCVSAAYGHENLVKIFHDYGGEVNIQLEITQKRTPFIMSVLCGHLAVTKLLLNLGAEIDQQDDDGDTALAYESCEKGPCRSSQ